MSWFPGPPIAFRWYYPFIKDNSILTFDDSTLLPIMQGVSSSDQLDSLLPGQFGVLVVIITHCGVFIVGISFLYKSFSILLGAD